MRAGIQPPGPRRHWGKELHPSWESQTLCQDLFSVRQLCAVCAVPTGDARAAGAHGVAVGAHGDGGVLLLLQRALLLHCAALHQGTH